MMKPLRVTDSFPMSLRSSSMKISKLSSSFRFRRRSMNGTSLKEKKLDPTTSKKDLRRNADADDERDEPTMMESFLGGERNGVRPACLICLDPMTLADLAHPLMCPSSACNYNFCLACIESLLEQQQQPAAADNNNHTPAGSSLWLHCPNCRSNLGPTICDTVLLRKVDGLSSATTTCTPSTDTTSTTCTSTSAWACREHEEHHTRWALHRAMGSDVTLLREIAEARDREVHFLQTKLLTRQQQQQQQAIPGKIDMHNNNNNNNEPRQAAVADNDDEEWGFEVDLRVGAHESIKLPRECFPLSVFQTSEFKADTTLLAGLEGALSPQEQKQLTRYMTSGDTSQLATAAQILATVAESVQLRRSYNSVHSSGRSTSSNSGLVRSNTESSKQQLRRPSIYSWVENGKRARSNIGAPSSSHYNHPSDSTAMSDAGSVVPVYHHNYSPYTKYYAGKVTEHRQIDRQLRETLNFLRRHPLPVRMPKYVEFVVHFDNIAPQQLEMQQIVKSLPVRFCNDTWDGTILDAFSKINVTPHNNHFYLRRQGGGGGTSSFQSPYRTGKNYSHRFRPTSTFVNNYSVTHRPPETDGIRHILNHHHSNNISDSDHPTTTTTNNNSNNRMRIDTPHPRILIAAVCDAQARQQGVFKGDVVTHVNGVELRDACVDDLMALICSLLYQPPSPMTTTATVPAEKSTSATKTATTTTTTTKNQHSATGQTRTTLTLQLVLNADQATAEALKLRAMACHS